MGDTCIVGDANPADAPSLNSAGVHAISIVFTSVLVCLDGLTRLKVTLVYYLNIKIGNNEYYLS